MWGASLDEAFGEGTATDDIPESFKNTKELQYRMASQSFEMTTDPFQLETFIRIMQQSDGIVCDTHIKKLTDCGASKMSIEATIAYKNRKDTETSSDEITEDAPMAVPSPPPTAVHSASPTAVFALPKTIYDTDGIDVEFIRTEHIPIADNTFSKVNKFAIPMTNGFHITNIRIDGPTLSDDILNMFEEVSLYKHDNVIDSAPTWSSWRAMRALFADDQTCPGRLPFSCTLRGHSVPNEGFSLGIVFNKHIRTFDTSTIFISYDIVKTSEKSNYFLKYTRVSHEKGPTVDIYGMHKAAGFLIKGAAKPVSIARDDVITSIKAGFTLGDWTWYAFGQSMLVNYPTDELIDCKTLAHLNMADNAEFDMIWVALRA